MSRAAATLGAADTMHATPTIGARATGTPIASSGVAPLSTGRSICQTKEAGSASSATSTPTLTSACTFGSSPESSTFSCGSA